MEWGAAMLVFSGGTDGRSGFELEVRGPDAQEALCGFPSSHDPSTVTRRYG